VVRGLLRIRVGGVEGDRHAGRLEHLHVRERVPDGRGALFRGPELLNERRDADPLVGQVHHFSSFPGEASVLVGANHVRDVAVESELLGYHLRGQVYPPAHDDAADAVVLQGGDRLLDPVYERHVPEKHGNVPDLDVRFHPFPKGDVPPHELVLVDLAVAEGLVVGLAVHSQALVDPCP
jgi:hypothetical protein